MAGYKRKREIHPPRDWSKTPYMSGPAYKKRYSGPSSAGSFKKGYDRQSGYYGRFSGRNQEWKFHDISIVDAEVSTTANIVQDSCNKIAQGTTESTRIGRKCVLRQINFRYQVNLPEKQDQTNPVAGDNVRVVLFIDKQCNGAAAATTDILESGTNFQSFNNLANSGRFITLMDKTHTVNYQTLTADAANNYEHARVVRVFKYYKKCNIPIEFNSINGAITEIRSNNVGVLLISSDGVAEFIGNMRIRFSDS